MTFSKIMTIVATVTGGVAVAAATGGLGLPAYVGAIATVVSTVAAKLSQSPMAPTEKKQ
jgi:hypothetical protein